jgi:hypothetical protein
VSGSCRRLISTVCLLAYLVASAPGYVTSALWQPCNAGCHACADARTVHACSACCCSQKHQGRQEAHRGDVGECACIAVRTSSDVLTSSPGHREDIPALPCDSACPDGCLLCNAGGSMPLPFTPVPVLEGLNYLGVVNAGTFLGICQPHPDELIRPPMC